MRVSQPNAAPTPAVPKRKPQTLQPNMSNATDFNELKRSTVAPTRDVKKFEHLNRFIKETADQNAEERRTAPQQLSKPKPPAGRQLIAAVGAGGKIGEHSVSVKNNRGTSEKVEHNVPTESPRKTLKSNDDGRKAAGGFREALASEKKYDRKTHAFGSDKLGHNALVSSTEKFCYNVPILDSTRQSVDQAKAMAMAMATEFPQRPVGFDGRVGAPTRQSMMKLYNEIRR